MKFIVFLDRVRFIKLVILVKFFFLIFVIKLFVNRNFIVFLLMLGGINKSFFLV